MHEKYRHPYFQTLATRSSRDREEEYFQPPEKIENDEPHMYLYIIIHAFKLYSILPSDFSSETTDWCN